jgi:hypothetical protein
MVNPLAETYLNEANKLDGSNFINWKFKMQTLMEGYGVWNIAKGTELKPDAAAGATTTQIQDWEKRENKAKVLLCMSVKDSIIPHIREATTSAATWTTLKALYETSNTNRILFLKTKLLGIKMDGNESVSSFLGRIKEVKDKLVNIGETVSNTDLVTITLNGMLEDYHMFITGLAAREKPPTFEELTGILLQEEERRGNLKPQNKDLALWSNKRSARGRSGERGRGGSSWQRGGSWKRGSSSQRRQSPNQGMQSDRNESKSCFYCGRPGHIVKDCHKKKSDEARNKPRTHSGHYAEKCQIMISDYLLLVMILMNPQILTHGILGCLCLTLLYLLKQMILMPGLWILEHQYI